MDAAATPNTVQTIIANTAAANPSQIGADTPSLDELNAQFGAENVQGAQANLAADVWGERAKEAIAEAFPGPDGEAAREMGFADVDAQVAAMQRPTTPDAQTAIDEIYQNIAEADSRELLEEARNQAGEAGGGKGKNWLVLVMSILSKLAGEHIARTVEISERIGRIGQGEGDAPIQITEGMSDAEVTNANNANSSSAADQARETTALQGEMQAEMQLFKMLFEAAASIGKTVGAGYQSMARAQ